MYTLVKVSLNLSEIAGFSSFLNSPIKPRIQERKTASDALIMQLTLMDGCALSASHL